MMHAAYASSLFCVLFTISQPAIIAPQTASFVKEMRKQFLVKTFGLFENYKKQRRLD